MIASWVIALQSGTPVPAKLSTFASVIGWVTGGGCLNAVERRDAKTRLNGDAQGDTCGAGRYLKIGPDR